VIFIPRNMLITAAFLLACVFTMGFYVLHLKRQSEEAATRIQLQSLTPHATGPQEKIPVFIAYDDDGVIREETDSVPEVSEPSERAREVLRALLTRYLEKPSPHPLGVGSEVKDVYIVNRNLAVVDINSDFANQHRSGVLVESLTIASMIETLAINVPQITRVKIMVDGKERDTLSGHADLMGTYNVSDVHALVKAMQ
jgi:sporulation and spore germination protein